LSAAAHLATNRSRFGNCIRVYQLKRGQDRVVTGCHDVKRLLSDRAVEEPDITLMESKTRITSCVRSQDAIGISIAQ
jgi:hypothetical protein